jgi:carbon monoxide dehydrogenase subunit G
MMRISNSVLIQNTPEEIFYWLEDPGRAMEWMSSVSKTEIIQEVPGMVGTTFREYIEEEGRGTEMRGVVTEFMPGRRMAFHLEGDYNTVEVSYSLEEKGEATLLSQEAEIRFKGLLGIFSLILGSTFKKKLISQSQSELARLKELCERDL